MPKQVWICDKCGERFGSKEEADKCEKTHIPAVKVVGNTYIESPMTGGMFRKPPYPSKITVEFDNGVTAIYVRQHIGPEAV